MVTRKRRASEWIQGAACLTAILAVACSSDERPDILLVTLDTTRADHLGCYGHPGGTSPHLDRLAEVSTVYEHAYATSSWTLASHASILTGLLPAQHGAQSVPGGPNKSLGYGVRPLAEHFTTVAEALRPLGYRTAAVVAGPALRRELGVAQGFEIYRDELDTTHRKFHGKLAEEVTDEALEAIARFEGMPGGAPETDPWFLFVNYFDPHAPYRPPAPHDAGLPEKQAPNHLQPLYDKLRAGLTGGPEDLPAETRDALATQRARYEAEIRYMDLHLGRLLDAIDLDRTLVVITGDHGESFGEHLYLSHGAHLYEDNVRVPLVVRRPGQRRGERVAEPVQNHRVATTILEAAGARAPASRMVPPLERRDAEPIVTAVRRSETNVTLLGDVLDRDLRAFYEPPLKLIESSRGGLELFDLDADPGEREDLSQARPNDAHRLRDALTEMLLARPPLYEHEARVDLSPETEDSLRALGYIE